jgi:hypothetical protein
MEILAPDWLWAAEIRCKCFGLVGLVLKHIPEKLHGFSDKNMRKNKQLDRFEGFSLNEKALG